MAERKTELAKDLQELVNIERRVACSAILNRKRATARAAANRAAAYEHAAELADEQPPDLMRPAVPSARAAIRDAGLDELPDGWERLSDDSHGPRFRSANGSRVEINDLAGACSYIVIDTDDGAIPMPVLRAFIAAMDAMSDVQNTTVFAAVPDHGPLAKVVSPGSCRTTTF